MDYLPVTESCLTTNHRSATLFVTRKIVRSALRISIAFLEKLTLGRLDIVRWGWAPEFVEATWRMVQQSRPSDLVLSTGVSVSLEVFVKEVFMPVRLYWRKHVITDQNLYRPSDIDWRQEDASRTKELIGWEARTKMLELAKMLVDGAGAEGWVITQVGNMKLAFFRFFTNWLLPIGQRYVISADDLVSKYLLGVCPIGGIATPFIRRLGIIA